MNTGLVFDLQRASVHDGPGIRTTVFLKGCPLRCAWCHNPESQRGAPELSYDPDRCLACGRCVAACPGGRHGVGADGHRFARAGCTACGGCADVCPALALERVGRPLTVAEVMAEVRQDLGFYRDSGGGLTLSGGEPLAQPAFAAELLAAAAAEGIHTAIETCAYAPWSAIAEVLPHCRLFLVDLKAEAARHRELTGVPLEPIRDNLRRLHDTGATIWLRLPLVPGLTDSAERWTEAAGLCAELPRLARIQIIPYHPLGRGKRQRLGVPEARPAETPDAGLVQQRIATLALAGVRAEIVG